MKKANTPVESEVRFYSRLFPSKFSTATGAYVYDNEGKPYLDFFCGSGSLNYGHSHPDMKAAVIEYIQKDGIINSLDMMTEARLAFMEKFQETILQPRNLNYKFQFCGPTGTNCVEAALKLSRKFTNREKVIFFEHSFHGMTYGAMSVSGMKSRKLHSDYTKNTIEMPFADKPDSLRVLNSYLENCSEEDLPAAIILETVQAEGGIKEAPPQWLKSVAEIAGKYAILLIIDEIQTGCGRTGTFFSFDKMNIKPDIICLSKSISGYGFPMSMNLINPLIDCWNPGEHNGTFRGNNLAFITAAKALDHWIGEGISHTIMEHAVLIDELLLPLIQSHKFKLQGRGFMRGIVLNDEQQCILLQRSLFKDGILMDTCGPKNNVIKIMPPITISKENLAKGLNMIAKAIDRCFTPHIEIPAQLTN